MYCVNKGFSFLKWKDLLQFKPWNGIYGCTNINLQFQQRIKSSKAYKGHSKRDRGRIDFPHYNVYSSSKVRSFVKNLDECERQTLYSELQKYIADTSINDEKLLNNSSPSVSRSQLKWLFVYNCVPFIGFGFLDNAIMIVAGEYIDLTIGCMLGISTMAAAALGNLVSDIAGLGLASYVEILCGKMGLPIPDLSSQQLELPESRFSANSGKAFGIAFGCVLGMFPLLFLKERKDNDAECQSENG